uniref:S1 family peptidase n=1 Tax=Herbidospora sakaeratensis TaxID=564415 RepID=UPI000780934B|nr:serine protease [Herbidospora sakaeratensis]
MIEKLLALVVLVAVAGCGQAARPTTQATPVPMPVSVPPEVAPHRQNVVRVTVATPSCAKDTAQGTGFAYAPDRVLTTAHVVAGAEGPITVTGADGSRHQGDVVVFDPKRDVAVLRVAGLDADVLHFDSVDPGERATFAAYSKDGEFTVRSGRAGAPQTAVGNDIYDEDIVARQVFLVHAAVDPAMSGAPLFGPDGDVIGMVFASNLDDSVSGWVISTGEIARPAAKGLKAAAAVSTRQCD